MSAVWINPDKAKLSNQERKEWLDLMAEHHPEHDWAAAMENLIEANDKGIGRKSKKD